MLQGRQFLLLLFSFILLARVAVAESLAPAYVLQLPASVEGVLIVETEKNVLHRYVKDRQKLKAVSRSYVSIGQNGAGKQRAWDRRTPLGIYFANDVLDTTLLHEKYGPLAFPLDYPNAWDELMARTGYGIWIHGVVDDSERRPPRDTDGCIALPNHELQALQRHLQLLSTPVIITRQIRTATTERMNLERQRLQAALEGWVESYRGGDLHRYLSIYADDFSYRGLDRQEWSAYRANATKTRQLLDYSIDEVFLLADPEEEGLFLSRFRQTIVDDSGSIVTIKRLYWLADSDGELRIVAEDNG